MFALWSDDPPDEDFVGLLEAEFPDVASHVVEFDNFLTGGTSANTVYVAHSHSGCPNRRDTLTIRLIFLLTLKPRPPEADVSPCGGDPLTAETRGEQGAGRS